jgi:phage shock protein PspC (stress-responsive transcriptional regulator)
MTCASKFSRRCIERYSKQRGKASCRIRSCDSRGSFSRSFPAHDRCVIAYLLAWAIVPRAASREQAATTPRRQRTSTNVKIGGVCAAIAEYFNVDPTMSHCINCDRSFWPR